MEDVNPTADGIVDEWAPPDMESAPASASAKEFTDV